MNDLTVHEFGLEQDKVIVLMHPSIVTWEFYALVIPLLKEHYHLIMPEPIPEYRGHLQYWYGDKETEDRAEDIRYVKAHFPRAEFLESDGIGHAGS